MIRKWNEWYDRQEEPKRFLLFFVPFAVAVVVLGIPWAMVVWQIPLQLRLLYLFNLV